MTVIMAWLRIELRRRWRSLVVLALLIAISSATVFTAIAGARREASAIDRLQAQTLPADAIVTPFEPHFDWDVVQALPQVEALATFSDTTNLIDGIPDASVTQFTPADSAALDTIERPVVLAGRLADPARADEAVVTPKFVESFGRGIGDTATVRLNSPETYDAISRAQIAAPGPGRAPRARMTRRQGRGVVITQASLLAGFGLLFGVPLGIALGRVIWRLIADNTPMAYVAPGTALAALLVVAAALLLANLLAALPGQRAARLPVHRILRAE